MGSIQSSPILSAPVQAVLRASGISPSDFVYVNLSDTLVLTEWDSVAGLNLRVVFRVMDTSGNIHLHEHDLTTGGSRVSQIKVRSLGEGILLSVNGFILPEGTRRGQVYLSVQFQTGGFPQNIRTQTLCSGYITSTDNVTFPRGGIDKAFEGYGNIRSITGTTPAAGADISETVPTGAYWNLYSLRAVLTSSATVATRTPQFVLDDGANTLLQIFAVTGIPATNTGFYTFGPGMQNATGSGITVVGLPSPLRLAPGFRIRTLTNSLQVGDQWSNVQYEVEEWLQS